MSNSPATKPTQHERDIRVKPNKHTLAYHKQTLKRKEQGVKYPLRQVTRFAENCNIFDLK